VRKAESEAEAQSRVADSQPEESAAAERPTVEEPSQEAQPAGQDLEAREVAWKKTASTKTVIVAPRPSIREVFSSHGPCVLIGIFGTASIAILQYGGFVWMQSYLMKRGLPAGGQMLTDLCARGLMILLAVPVGWLADVWGVGWTVFVGSCSLAVAGLPLFHLLSMHATNLAVVLPVIGVCFAVLGALAGTVTFYFVTELFPTTVRGVAVGVSWNIGLSMFGGLAPVIAQASLEVSPAGPGFLISFGGIVTATTVAVGLWLKRRGIVQLAHVRPVPYFLPLDEPNEKATDRFSFEIDQASA